MALALSADERTVIVYCLDSYKSSISQSEYAIDQMLGALHLSTSRAQHLLEQIYVKTNLNAGLCAELSDALLAWRAVSGNTHIPVEAVYEKLKAAAQ